MSAIGLPTLLPVSPSTRVRPSVSQMEHPLTNPLRRMARASEHARASIGLAGRPLEAWTLATELGDAPSPRLDACLRRVGAHDGTADRLVMSSLFFSSYVWHVAVAAFGCYVLARR